MFIVSPDAVKSQRCTWDVDRTLDLSKRLGPVIHKPVVEAHMPDQLRLRQFVDFPRGAGITRPLRELAEALNRDVEWICEHIRLGELQHDGSRATALTPFSCGDEVDAAKMWAVKRMPEAPAA